MPTGTCVLVKRKKKDRGKTKLKKRGGERGNEAACAGLLAERKRETGKSFKKKKERTV